MHCLVIEIELVANNKIYHVNHHRPHSAFGPPITILLIHQLKSVRHREVCASRQKTGWTFLAQEQSLPRAVSPRRHHEYEMVCSPPSELPPLLVHSEFSLRLISTASVPSEQIYIRVSAPLGIQAGYKYKHKH